MRALRRIRKKEAGMFYFESADFGLKGKKGSRLAKAKLGHTKIKMKGGGGLEREREGEMRRPTLRRVPGRGREPGGGGEVEGRPRELTVKKSLTPSSVFPETGAPPRFRPPARAAPIQPPPIREGVGAPDRQIG